LTDDAGVVVATTHGTYQVRRLQSTVTTATTTVTLTNSHLHETPPSLCRGCCRLSFAVGPLVEM
jgi:hypothetical protein